ncbi:MULTISPECIES: flagellar biosynthesis anti-sigma factor FlgM [Ureibacillus]|uniref:Negative regulator of flagellin synthesis n=1 Tax=Ureibacillus thermosphaericus TaxID=51173 RepID=A0A840PUW1_URETH|nr:flagellar biosynthesis anti-sigma factor FlgM [Ureibacillus thermosphaericus]MBB5149717.1 negative regulator of flagellin synthesis FlgM [Ureibacillus thermosphaericus]NKZ32649.1 flagellar biosynthesis anti-sigma factor FlgM [Ureibacillus thermosphaericus]
MKINPINTNSVNPYTKQQRNVNTVKAKNAFADRIEISDAAKEMQVVSDYSQERAEKIQKLKKEIQSGQYKVDAQKVAEDMLKYYRLR